MIDLDVSVLLIAGAAFVGLFLWVAAQLVEDARRRPRAPELPLAAIGETVRLTCCEAPDVPEGGAYCIRCGRQVQV